MAQVPAEALPAAMAEPTAPPTAPVLNFKGAAQKEKKDVAIKTVQLVGSVALKILQHCSESDNTGACGQLLGLDVSSTLEVTECFPSPVRRSERSFACTHAAPWRCKAGYPAADQDCRSSGQADSYSASMRDRSLERVGMLGVRLSVHTHCGKHQLCAEVTVRLHHACLTGQIRIESLCTGNGGDGAVSAAEDAVSARHQR